MFAAQLTLAHAVSDHFAAAKLYFFTIGGEIFFHFNDQFGVAKANFIAHGGTEHFCIGLPAYGSHNYLISPMTLA